MRMYDDWYGSFSKRYEHMRKPYSNPQEMEEWWSPYVEPLPTWDIYDPRWYAIALGHLRRRLPTIQITEPINIGYMSGLIEGESYLGYIPHNRRMHTAIRVMMMDKPPVDFLSQMFNVKTTTRLKDRYETYRFSIIGIKTILALNIITPQLKGKRKDEATFMLTHGYVVKDATVDEFKRRFRARWILVETETESETETSPQLVEACLTEPPERPPIF